MQAIILAGGQGIRLKPYTTVLPKPLLPVNEKPIIEIIIRQLAEAGIKEIIVSVGYLGQLLEAYLRDGSQYGIKIDYSREEKPLGTAGPISLIDNVSDDFFVINGDTLCDVDFTTMLQEHRDSANAATVSAYRKKHTIDLGTLELDDNLQITAYNEKPTIDYIVSMGIYVFKSSVKKELEVGAHLDLPDFIMQLRDKGYGVGAYMHSGIWMDMGRPSDFEKIQDEESLSSQVKALIGKK